MSACPSARCFAEAGIRVVLVDVDAERVASINRGESYVEDVPAIALAPLVEAGALAATTDYDAVRDADAIVVALPTPLSANREPDLSIVLGAARELGEAPAQRASSSRSSRRRIRARRARRCSRSSAESGLEVGKDFFLAFSPERIDPGREDWTVKTTPKVVGGVTPACTERAVRLLRAGDRHRLLASPHPRPPS